jgi:hypothetical protein
VGISGLEMMLHQLGFQVELGKGIAAAERAFLSTSKTAVPAPAPVATGAR